MVLDRDVLAFDGAGFAEAFAERSDTGRIGRAVADESDDRNWLLLRARRKRPGNRRAGNRCDEVASSHRSPTCRMAPSRVLRSKGSTHRYGGRLLRCGISIPSMSGWGQSLHIDTPRRVRNVCFTPNKRSKIDSAAKRRGVP